ncbi:N-succinylarginine dihydrolase, partial [Oleiphilus sp. HI0067]
FCSEYDKRGVQLFAYGRTAFNESELKPKRYPARQTLEACQAVARLHELDDANVVYAQQKPSTIDAGVFHNDVISVGNRDVFFCHEQAFLNQDQVFAELQKKLGDTELKVILVPESEVPLADAVSSYLFNSQLLSISDDKMALVVPSECDSTPSVAAYLKRLVKADNPIAEVMSFDLKQSMKNGGGPACLRLRVALNENELAAIHPGVLFTDQLY